MVGQRQHARRLGTEAARVADAKDQEDEERVLIGAEETP